MSVGWQVSKAFGWWCEHVYEIVSARKEQEAASAAQQAEAVVIAEPPKQPKKKGGFRRLFKGKNAAVSAFKGQ